MASLENFPIDWAGQQAVVTLPAEIDIGNADQVSDTLLAVLNRGVSMLVADMTGTTFCACAGVTALIRAHRRATANRALLRVAATAPIVLRVLELTGVDYVIPVFGTVPAALAAPSGRASRPENEDPARAGVG
ncbi:MAG TPA: STAS domain-containing protein [Streptosporangiaceae bacterium]|jgi:anti-anti-sigma factor|nr:STAS domain-containing protein [Streptosporangiaceae bacterium]